MTQNDKKPAGSDRNFGAQTNETELANDRMGNNQLEGDDQNNVRNERKAMAGGTTETEGVIESFKNSDPKERTGGQ